MAAVALFICFLAEVVHATGLPSNPKVDQLARTAQPVKLSAGSGTEGTFFRKCIHILSTLSRIFSISFPYAQKKVGRTICNGTVTGAVQIMEDFKTAAVGSNVRSAKSKWGWCRTHC
jgi:hypothetical protein